MAPIIYLKESSPPVRGVLLTAAAISLELERREVNLVAQDHRTPEFLKLNPQHTIPTLVDGKAVIWESHAILPYLIGKYAKGSPLYPEDLVKRATVDQRLHFDTGVLFPILKAFARPILTKMSKTITPEDAKECQRAYQFLETFLDGQEWIAGHHLTIADLSIIASVSSMDFFLPVSEETYPKLSAWIGRCQTLPYYQSANQIGLEIFKNMFIPSML